MSFLFASTLFLSATLLFLLQPMIGKMVLPLLGGTPAVWNTCMVFFQAALLAGYLYAHTVTRRFPVRLVVFLQICLLVLGAVPLLLLHLDAGRIGRDWLPPPAETYPIPWLLGLLLLSVGVPFLVTATSAPLLQHWFTHTGHRQARDPYFLYAASNLGSMLALLGYPTLIEPNLGLAAQRWIWIAGFGLLVGLTAICGLAVRRSLPEQEKPAEKDLAPAPAPTTWRRLRWIALAFVASSIMLGATAYITTDVAAVPLLWVLPLALYLLSFILVFSRFAPGLHVVMVVLLGPVVLLLGTGLVIRIPLLTWQLIVLHLFAVFVTAMVCHGELARTRPAPRYLTEFYLWMAVGGVLGGMFNTLAAPLLFNHIVEYPLVIVVACLLLPRTEMETLYPVLAEVDAALRHSLMVVGAAVGLLLVIASLASAYSASGMPGPLRWLVGKGQGSTLHVLHQERTFFGEIRVQRYTSEDGDFHEMIHGTTVHGMQALAPERRREPLTYFHSTGPIGHVFEVVEQRRNQRVAVIGMGTGTLAAYAQPGWEMTFYEIDPAVVRMANNRDYFTFLSDSRDRGVQVHTVLGDGRLKLARAPDQAYDLLFLDAFSSDAVPIHMLTREAFEMYFTKLAPGGLLVVNIANRYLDLDPVLGNLAASLRLHGVVEHDNEDATIGKYASAWVVLARDAKDLAPLLDYEDAGEKLWKPLPTDPRRRVWTDDFSNLLGAFDWRN